MDPRVGSSGSGVARDRLPSAPSPRGTGQSLEQSVAGLTIGIEAITQARAELEEAFPEFPIPGSGSETGGAKRAGQFEQIRPLESDRTEGPEANGGDRNRPAPD